MVHFHSLRSFRRADDGDFPGEGSQQVVDARTTDEISKKGLFPEAGMMPGQGLSHTGQFTPTNSFHSMSGMTPPFGLGLPSHKRTAAPQTDVPVVPNTEPLSQISTDRALQIVGEQLVRAQSLQMSQTGQLRPVALRVYDARSNTQSLVMALQSTLQPQATGRAPLFIPAEKKRVRREEDGEEQVRLKPYLRHLLIALATLSILLFTMLTMTPLGSGQSGIALLDGATHLVNINNQSWSLIGQPWDSTKKPASKSQQSTTTTTTTTTTTSTTSDDTNMTQSQYIALAEQDATEYGISPVYFVRQINKESGFNPYAASAAGAVGIAQFEPATAASMGINPYDPVEALAGAAQMMASLSSQYGGDYAKALAAYNAGSGAVDSAVAEGGSAWLSYLPAETQNYVNDIMS